MMQTPHNQFQYKIWEPPMRTYPMPFDSRVIFLERVARQEPRISISLGAPERGGLRQELKQKIVYHSPTGLEFGYGGSGPADTALNILALIISPKEAHRLHQAFKWEVLCRIKQEGGELAMQDVVDWVTATYDNELDDAERMNDEKQMHLDAAELVRMDKGAAADYSDTPADREDDRDDYPFAGEAEADNERT